MSVTNPYACYNFLQERKNGMLPHLWMTGSECGPDYNDYIDGATKSTLANVQNRQDKTQGGSDSVEIAGPARVAPLVSHLASSTEEEVVRASVEQTILTHRSPEAEESAAFLAKAGYRLIHGANLLDTLNETAPVWALQKAEQLYSQKIPWMQSVNLGPLVPFHPPSPRFFTLP
jgi:ADP-ribosylglycohydrolase